MKRSESPASIWSLEHLQVTSKRLLNNSVQAKFGTGTTRVAFIDTSTQILLKMIMTSTRYNELNNKILVDTRL